MKLHRVLLGVAALAWLSPAFGAQVSDVPSGPAPVHAPALQLPAQPASVSPLSTVSAAQLGAPLALAPAPAALPAPPAGVSPLSAVSAAELEATRAAPPTPAALAARTQATAIVQAAVYAQAYHLDSPSFTRLSLAALKGILRAQGQTGAKAARSPAIAQLRDWLKAPHGLSLGLDEQGAFVDAVRPGSMAARAGVRPGLRVPAVNGELTGGMSRESLAAHLDRAAGWGLEPTLAGVLPDGRPALQAIKLPATGERWAGLFAAHLQRLAPERVESAAAAALRSLAGRLDRFTRYLEPADGARFRQHLTELKEEGFGLAFEGDARTICAVLDGSPAAVAGLRAGDRIIAANGTPLDGSAETVKKAFAGRDEARLVVRRGTEELAVAMKAGSFVRSSVLGQRLAEDIAYFRISSFTGMTGADLVQAYRAVSRDGAPRAAVIDLRGNPGGEITGALTVAAAFLPAGRVIVRDRMQQENFNHVTQAQGLLAGIPLAVLIDEDSASASELLAVALKDNDAAVIVGRPSFGKNVGQRLFALENGGTLSVTIRSVEGSRGTRADRPLRGLQPDVRVRQNAAGRRASALQAVRAALGARVDPSADAELRAALAALRPSVTPAM